MSEPIASACTVLTCVLDEIPWGQEFTLGEAIGLAATALAGENREQRTALISATCDALDNVARSRPAAASDLDPLQPLWPSRRLRALLKQATIAAAIEQPQDGNG